MIRGPNFVDDPTYLTYVTTQAVYILVYPSEKWEW